MPDFAFARSVKKRDLAVKSWPSCGAIMGRASPISSRCGNLAGNVDREKRPMTHPDATLEQRLRAIEDRLEIYNLIAGHPPERRHRRGGLCGGGLHRGRRSSIAVQASPARGRQQSDRGQSQERGPPGRDRRRARPFHRPAAYRARRRPRRRHLLFADPDAEGLPASRSKCPITAPRAAITSTASSPTAGNFSAPPRAGRSGAARCAWSTARERLARDLARRARGAGLSR